jgi:hypothetical protein
MVLLPLVDFMDSKKGKEFIGKNAKVTSLGEGFSLEWTEEESAEG